MANYLGSGGFNPEAYMMRKIMDELFGGGAEKEASAQRQQNRYERLYAQKVGATEGNYDVKQLDAAYNRGEKFRADIVAGRYKIPDQEIFLETIDSHQENLDRYRSSVQDYDAKSTTYRNTSNQIADLSQQLNILHKSSKMPDYGKSRDIAKQITELMADQTKIFSDMTTRYSSRFKNDIPLNDYMNSIRVSNQYLIDFMGDDYLSDWEKSLYQRANTSGDYSVIQKGIAQMDSLKQSFMGDEKAKIQTLHQTLRNNYSVLATGKTAEGVGLDDLERGKLANESIAAQNSLEASLKLYEENTGDALLGQYLNDTSQSPWLTEDTFTIERGLLPAGGVTVDYPGKIEKEIPSKKVDEELPPDFESKQLEELESNETKLDTAIKSQMNLKSRLKKINENMGLGYDVDPSLIKDIKQKLQDVTSEISSLQDDLVTPRQNKQSLKNMKSIKEYAKRILISKGFATAENIDSYIIKNKSNWDAAIREAKNAMRKPSSEYDYAAQRQGAGKVPAYLTGERAPKP